MLQPPAAISQLQKHSNRNGPSGCNGGICSPYINALPLELDGMLPSDEYGPCAP